MSELKLLIMSATLETDTFCEYFDCTQGPVRVTGRQFPVQILYTASAQEDYVAATVTTTLQIHQDCPAGDILVFLTGQVGDTTRPLRSHAKAHTFAAKGMVRADSPLIDTAGRHRNGAARDQAARRRAARAA